MTEELKVVAPGLVAAIATILATFVLEPYRQKQARRLKLVERRFDAQAKLVGALTRLDQVSAEYEECAMRGPIPEGMSDATAGAYREALTQLAESRFFLTEAQFTAVREFLRRWDSADNAMDLPSASIVVSHHFGPERALDLPMLSPARRKRLAEPHPLPTKKDREES